MLTPGVPSGVVALCGIVLLCVQCGPSAGAIAGRRAAPARTDPQAATRSPAPSIQAAAPTADAAIDAGADAGAPAWSPPTMTEIEQELADLVNRERTSRGLPALAPDGRLTAAARGHSQEMGELGYFDHRSPTPGLHAPIDRFLRVLAEEGSQQPPHLLLGENIYHISEFSEYFNVEFGHRAIMKSPSHRAAVLEPRYTKVGVGVYRNAGGELWATEMFLRDTPWQEEGESP